MVDKSVIGRKLSLVEEHRRRIKGLPALTIEVFKKDTTVIERFGKPYVKEIEEND